MNDILNQIYCWNTLDILKKLPSDFIDMWVTSPPYNKKENKKWWLVKNVKYDSVSDNKEEENYQNEQIEVLNELYRTIKEWWSFFYNHKTRWEKWNLIHPMDWLRKTKWIVRQEIIWDRMIAANIRWWRFWQIEERIYWLYKPKWNKIIWDELNSKHALLSSIWRFWPEKNSSHPAPFPIELPTRAIYSIMDEKKEGIIIDPYSWSWTTLVSAKALKHNYIWIDISEEYINFSKNRIENYHSEQNKINEELNKHFVRKTFKERKENGEYTWKFKQKNEIKKECLKTLFDVDLIEV